MKLFSGLLSLTLLAPWFSTQAQDVVVGEVLGKAVHESQIKSTSDRERASSLRAALISPAIGAYLKSHEDEVALSEAESKALIESFRAHRKCNPDMALPEMEPSFDKFLAQMLGGNIKAQRFIYLNHGHGRVLFQQAGMEAFDATYQLILQLERNGDIRFSSAEDRALALSYWTTQNHSSFLQPDPGPDEAFKLESVISNCPS